MKWFHNDKVSLGWAIFSEILVHGLFALGAFLLGSFLGDLILGKLFGTVGEQIGAWSLAIFIFCAAFQTFVLGEYMREHVQSFERSKRGDGSYIRSWGELRKIVGGIEIASLLFRCAVTIQQGDYFPAFVILLFGLLSLRYAYLQAKVIHASVNRDVSYDVAQAKQKMTRDIVKDALDNSDDMLPSEKAEFIRGNTGILDGVRTRVERSRNKKEVSEQERNEREEEEFQRNRKTVEDLLNYPDFPNAQSNPSGNHLSQNGNHANRN